MIVEPTNGNAFVTLEQLLPGDTFQTVPGSVPPFEGEYVVNLVEGGGITQENAENTVAVTRLTDGYIIAPNKSAPVLKTNRKIVDS
jgi:hypothetical protein